MWKEKARFRGGEWTKGVVTKRMWRTASTAWSGKGYYPGIPIGGRIEHGEENPLHVLRKTRVLEI